MLDGLTAEQFNGWVTYSQLEPFGEERADLRSAIVACVIASVNQGKKGKKFTPQDFMPKFGPQKARRQSFSEMKANLMGLTGAVQGLQQKKKQKKDRKKKCR